MARFVTFVKTTNWPTVAVIVVPFILFVCGIILWAYEGMSWTPVILFFVMYYYTGFGITVGYHRLFTHDSFKPKQWLRFLLGLGGAMAFEGDPIHWVRIHRHHHIYSDEEEDPHSPHHSGGFWKGLYHSHLGWMISKTEIPPDDKHVKMLREDPVVKAIGSGPRYLFWAFLGVVLPTVVGGLIMRSWAGALQCFLWAGAFRVLYVHHITWSINSICHISGAQPFKTTDKSRNNWWVGVLSLGIGENWHNGHHAFPTSARHGLRWWEVDLSWYLIWFLTKVRLASRSDLRLPPPSALESKKR